MICGYAGCGRYSSQHAKKHHDESLHPFSLELASGRIWDYDSDTFVHIDRDQSHDDPAFMQSVNASLCDPSAELLNGSYSTVANDMSALSVSADKLSLLSSPIASTNAALGQEAISSGSTVVAEKLGCVLAQYESMFKLLDHVTLLL